MKLTFVHADIPLVKTITADAIHPYPRVKRMSSYDTEVNSHNEFIAALRSAASKGHALYKGHFIHPLENESRAGKTASTPTLFAVLDLDGLDSPIPIPPKTSKEDLEQIMSEFKKTLPEPWRSTTAIAHASTRWGMGANNKLRAHLFYMLSSPVDQKALKHALINLNLGVFKDQLDLSASGFALKYPLDVCCAENGRIIYVAPPTLKDVPSPFLSDDDRFVLLPGPEPFLDVEKLDTTDNSSKVRKAIVALRRNKGLPAQAQAKYRTITLNGERTDVLLNPPKGTFAFAYEARGFVYYNLNGGDSNAYFHPKGKPEYMYNFKGEPIVRFKDVDPETYEWYCETHKEEIVSANPIEAFAVLGYHDDKVYRVYHDRERNTVEVLPGNKQNLEEFYASNGLVYTGEIEHWRIDYDPTDSTVIDEANKRINTFIPTQFMREDLHVSPSIRKLLVYNNAAALSEIAPNIYKLVNHVVGEGTVELNHFINWLAYIWQTYDKPGTAWIFSGVEGTGKGILAHHVLKPLFGEQNTQFLLMGQIEDNFTEWRFGKLMVFIDEFDMAASGRKSRAVATLKNWITERTSPLRGMHKATRNAHVHDNYICFTNIHGALDVPESDRRWNIAPRQERPLRQVVEDIPRFINGLSEELTNFVGFLNDWTVDVSKAMVSLDNQAKRIMKQAAGSILQSFIKDLIDGDIDMMLEVMALESRSPTEGFHHETLRAIVMGWLKDAIDGVDTFVLVEEAAAIYNAIARANVTGVHIGKSLRKRGITTTRAMNKRGRRGSGITVRWCKSRLTNAELVQFYNKIVETEGEPQHAVH